MAVTSYKSDQYTAGHSAPAVTSMESFAASLKSINFAVTQTVQGDATSPLYIAWLPAGDVEFHPWLSRIRWTAGGSSLVFDVGFEAYVGLDGAAVAVNATAFDNDIDVSAAGAAFLGSDISTGGSGGDTWRFSSKTGVGIKIVSAGAVVPAGMTVIGNLIYTQL
jgi:hypothetical protein